MTRSAIKALPQALAKLCLLAAAAAAASPAAAGGGLSVSPITIEFDPGGSARALEIANPGDEAVSVQVRLFNWRVDRDGDHYTPSRDIGFSPPMFRLAAGASQIVRMAPQASPANGERAYRLFVDQIGEAAGPGELKMPVRMVLPVFTSGAKGKAGPAVLSWRLEYDRRAGEAMLIAANAGSRRVKVTDLAFIKDGETHSLRPGLSGYVLAGQEFGWNFKVPGRLNALEVSANTEAGPVRARLVFPSD